MPPPRGAPAPDGPVEAGAGRGALSGPGRGDRGLFGHDLDSALGLSVWAGARQYRFAPVDHTSPWHESYQAAGDAALVPGRLPGRDHSAASGGEGRAEERDFINA